MVLGTCCTYAAELYLFRKQPGRSELPMGYGPEIEMSRSSLKIVETPWE
jgi:hypothetical protein